MSQSVWQEHNAPGTPAEQQCQCAACREYRSNPAKCGCQACSDSRGESEVHKESPAVQSLLQKLQSALAGTK